MVIYTIEFYIAIFLGILACGIIGFLVYSFFRGPKENQFEEGQEKKKFFGKKKKEGELNQQIKIVQTQPVQQPSVNQNAQRFV